VLSPETCLRSLALFENWAVPATFAAERETTVFSRIRHELSPGRQTDYGVTHRATGRVASSQ
jgi:hypothetical protein